MTIEDGTHSCSRNVVEKFILHTVQNPQNQKSANKSKFNKYSWRVKSSPFLTGAVIVVTRLRRQKT
jgi:hypothetical protein